MTYWKPLAALALGVMLVAGGVYSVLAADDAKWIVRTSWLNEAPKGPVRICGSGDEGKRAAEGYNKKYRPGSRAIADDPSSIADVQRSNYIQVVRENSDNCDVIWLDVVYMKEFAARGLLYDMTPYLASAGRGAKFDDRMLRTTEYDGRRWGVPDGFDVGVMYYRADLVRPPHSWQDVFERSRRPRGPGELPRLRVQFRRFEDLTVLLLELAYAAGAKPIVTHQGNTANLDQPAVHAALEFLRNAVREHVIPRQEESDNVNAKAYARGRASFMRGWPSTITLAEREANRGTPRERRVKRKRVRHTKIAALPPWRPGWQSVGVLGGHDLVIPRSARHPAAALALIDYMGNIERVRREVMENSQYPVRKDLVDELRASGEPRFARTKELIEAIDETTVRLRPSILDYADVSAVISCRTNEVMVSRGSVDISTRLKDMNREIQEVLDGAPAPRLGTCSQQPSL